MKKILKSTKYIRRNVLKKRNYSRKVFQLTRDSILRTSAGTQCRQVTRDDRVYKYSSFTRNSRRVGSRYRYTTRRNTARIQYNRSSMGFHEAVLVIGSSSSSPFLPSYRHRSHPSRFPIILSARKTLAGLILRDAMSSILLAIDRQFPPPFPLPRVHDSAGQMQTLALVTLSCPRCTGCNSKSLFCATWKRGKPEGLDPVYFRPRPQ